MPDAIEETPTLHVYSQASWHQEAFLLGDAAALKALHEAILVALAKGFATVEMFTADGEGYQLCLGLLDAEKEKLQLPYAEHPTLSQTQFPVSPEEAYASIVRRNTPTREQQIASHINAIRWLLGNRRFPEFDLLEQKETRAQGIAAIQEMVRGARIESKVREYLDMLEKIEGPHE